VATFPEIMMSQPSVYQGTTVATLMSSAKTLASGWSLYQSVANLTHAWGGSTQQTQAGQATTLASSGQQVLSSITQTQTQMNSGAQQIQGAKVRLQALVQAATAEGFVVLPTGQVILGPGQLAACSAHPGMAAYFKARATAYNGQIQAVVATTNASDLQTGLSLAKTGVDILNAILHPNGAATSAVPTAALPTDPTSLGSTSIGGMGTTPDQIGVNPGTSLAGAGLGDFHGVNSSGGLGGLTLPTGSLGSGPGLTGVSGVSGPGGIGGNGPGLAGIAGSTLAGSNMAGGEVGGAGRSAVGGAGGNTMVGMGGAGAQGAGQSDEEREARGWLLAEDEDPWTSARATDTTNGVIS
jgi:hypothetical protein